MANVIKPKRSNTASAVPTTGQLASGELAVNMADQKVYINNGTSVVQVGAGNLTGLGDVNITSVSNNQVLKYDSATSKWINGSGGGGAGDVVGPVSSTDNAITRFDGSTGTLIQNSTVTINDDGTFANVNAITFDTTPTNAPTTTQGSMFWDSGDGTPSVVLNSNTSLQLGQENVALVYNGTGSTITRGQVVAVSGAQGQRPSVVLADADSEPYSAATLGIAAEDIANGAEGFICTFGLVRGLDTSAFTAGDPIWLSQTAGAFTTTKPSAPAHLVFLGWVVKVNASSGEVFVHISNGWELDELHNVLITSPTSGNTLIYDATAGVWKNAGITAGTAISVTNGAGSITVNNTGVTSAVAGTGISVSGATGAVTITNTAPDQTVALSAGTGISVSGTYPNFTITNTSPSSGGTVTSVSGTGSYGGLTLTGTVTSSGSLTLGGTPTGTWPISVSGSAASAASATTASQIDGIEFRNGDSSNAINPDSVNNNGTGYINSVSLFGQTDGALYSQAYSTSWVHQIFGDYRTGQLAVRGRNNGTLTAWRTILDSSNYTSYAPTLTGSGASGTWSINITGNAGSVNGYSVSTSGSANTIPTRNASGYLSPASWIQLDGIYGLYSPTNGAHFYVNNATYGSWRVAGSRNGWAGLEFDPPSGGGTTLMMNRDTFGFHMNDTGWRFYNSGGSGYFPGNVVAYWSDGRLKENLRPIGSESLDIVSKISAYRFNWNEKVKEFNIPIEPGKEEIGLIAQEVQQVLPDAVVINQSAGKALPGGNKEKTDYLTINYDRITPILLQAINELRNRVEELENKIKSMNV